MAVRVHRGDDERAALHESEFVFRRPPDLQNQIGAERLRRRNEPRARRLIIGVDDASLEAGAVLDRDLRAERR